MNFHLVFSLCKEAPVQRLLLAIVKAYYPNLFLSLVQRDRESSGEDGGASGTPGSQRGTF